MTIPMTKPFYRSSRSAALGEPGMRQHKTTPVDPVVFSSLVAMQHRMAGDTGGFVTHFRMRDGSRTQHRLRLGQADTA